MDNLDAVLKAHGSSLAHTVKFNIYIIDYKDFAEINEHYIKRMPTPAPARSCIGVANLPRGTDVEIECVAVVPKVSQTPSIDVSPTPHPIPSPPQTASSAPHPRSFQR